MLALLCAVLLLLTAADHWTTYLALSTPVPGYVVSEVNPIADALFARVGIGPGLLLDGFVTIGALVFLMRTRRLPHLAKLLFLATVCAWTAAAVANNLDVIAAIGLLPWGAA